tara:strand:- start:2614 stop:3375 length:762 start_codon:yes stop_codon:yes gene_type:complete
MDIKEIVRRKSELIELKKAEIKTVKGGLTMLQDCSVIKTNKISEDSDNVLKRTIVGNTYMWMDSHDDVHAKGVFTKSIKERQNSIFHLHDHKFEVTAKVGEPSQVYEKEMSWMDFGVSKSGTTTALLMDSSIMKEYNSKVFNEYKSGRITQHSVGMQYVKMDLAVNDEEYEEEYKVWKDNIDNLGNSEQANEKGYFWFVREAKLIEISAVLLGSNSLTPTLENKQADLSSLDVVEPSDDTQEKELLTYYKSLN